MTFVAGQDLRVEIRPPKIHFMNNVLMVCMGNICRSPMAQAVGQRMVEDRPIPIPLTFDSAGTHVSRKNERPDRRAGAVLLRRGYAVDHLRARQISQQDFKHFDLILAMDASTQSCLRGLAPLEHVAKIQLFLSFSKTPFETDVPDPYYGNAAGFERVLDLCEAGVQGLIRHYTL